jgi:anti-sigma factor (TIGR02949 family)
MAEPTARRCEEALRRLMEFIDGELSHDERDSVEEHLSTCRSCFSRMEFERRLKERFAAIASDYVEMASRDRVRELIKRL